LPSVFILSSHCMFHSSCSLWTPQILQCRWFWTQFEKSDWICSTCPASTTPPSSSCGSNAAFARSFPLSPPSSSPVSPQRAWTAAATSSCEELFYPQTKCSDIFIGFSWINHVHFFDFRVKILSSVQPDMTRATQMSVVTHFIKAFLTRNNTAGMFSHLYKDGVAKSVSEYFIYIYI